MLTNAIIWYTLVFVVGACVGSFLNVCIHRIPRGQSVVRPGSRCPLCGAPIRGFDNIPMFSWLILGGKCRECKGSISFRYPLVEFLTAALFVGAWYFLPPMQAMVACIFVSILIVASFIDLDFLIIPDRLTLGGFVFFTVLSFLVPSIHWEIASDIFLINSIRSGVVALIGAFIGSGLLVWIAFLGEVIVKEEALGTADIKLLGLIGALCGWKGAIFTIFAGAGLASICLLPLVLMKKLKSRDPESVHTVVPFGPWLALAAILYYICFQEPVDSYFNDLSTIFYR